MIVGFGNIDVDWCVFVGFADPVDDETSDPG
jgi:hypothetical protein